MRSALPGYYQPNKEEFEELWKTCAFAFDASVLLDLYRSTAKTRKTLLDILERIQHRIWVPYHAALEYQENRLEVIAKEQTVYTELRDSINTLANSFKQKMENHAIENADKIAMELENATKNIERIIEEASKEHPDLRKSDHIRDQLTKLFEGRTGSKYDEKRLAEIYALGTKRYEQKIPPGYEDAKKGGTRQFGDLIVWNEMLDYSREKKQPVIFITSDSKEDWWWKQGQFTVGPRAELAHEMMSVAGQRFYMYNAGRFLDQAESHLDTKTAAGEVKKAAEEFNEIEQKRKLAQPADLRMEPTPDEASELINRLSRLSSSQWRNVPQHDFILAAEIRLKRPLSTEEKDLMARVLQQQQLTVDLLVTFYKDCWKLSEFLAGIVRTSARLKAKPHAATP